MATYKFDELYECNLRTMTASLEVLSEIKIDARECISGECISTYTDLLGSQLKTDSSNSKALPSRFDST